jgi:hypothetical protein
MKPPNGRRNERRANLPRPAVHLSGLDVVVQALVRMVNRTGCRMLALPSGTTSALEVA